MRTGSRSAPIGNLLAKFLDLLNLFGQLLGEALFQCLQEGY